MPFVKQVILLFDIFLPFIHRNIWLHGIIASRWPQLLLKDYFFTEMKRLNLKPNQVILQSSLGYFKLYFIILLQFTTLPFKIVFKQRKGIKVSRFIIPISHLVVNVWKQYDCMKFNKGIIHNIIKDIHALPHVLAITSLKFECQRKSLLCQDVGSKGTADQDVLLP